VFSEIKTTQNQIPRTAPGPKTTPERRFNKSPHPSKAHPTSRGISKIPHGNRRDASVGTLLTEKQNEEVEEVQVMKSVEIDE